MKRPAEFLQTPSFPLEITIDIRNPQPFTDILPVQPWFN
jgi:hypothetical protein